MSSFLCQDCIVDFKQDVMNMLIHTIELKDIYTSGHSEQVARYCCSIGNALNLGLKDTILLYQSAFMHDIGKILIDPKILQKNDYLTKEEYESVKKHSTFGAQMLQNINLFQEHAQIVKHHHERWDGTGYPDGLTNKKIPFFSRIIAIVDAFDAMTSMRNYKNKCTFDEALNELDRCSGTQFDPELVSISVKVLSAFINNNAFNKKIC
ncbi:HD/GGDEF domain response regulator [Sulfurospirillum multivorans DSM 12446]|nr:HD/GGDEF domain response regulator [Sulfurospirillum multivorans DSM 12446]